MAEAAGESKDVAAGNVVTKIAAGECIVSLHAGYETKGVYADGFLARPADGPGIRLLDASADIMSDQDWFERFHRTPKPLSTTSVAG